MSLPFSVVISGARARKAERREASRANGAARKAAAAARLLGIARVGTSSEDVAHARYMRDMGL